MEVKKIVTSVIFEVLDIRGLIIFRSLRCRHTQRITATTDKAATARRHYLEDTAACRKRPVYKERQEITGVQSEVKESSQYLLF